MKTKFDINLLNSFANENNIEITGNYEKLNRDSIINGKCNTIDCVGEFSKVFRMLVKNKGFYCSSCQNSIIQTKMKKTNLIKYGCEFNLHNNEIKQKRTNTFIEKYGCHPSQNINIKQKKKETFIKNYGVDNILKSEEFRNKMKNLFLEKYGGHPSQNINIKQKMKKTNLIKYGTECSLNNIEVRNKCINNNLLKYGVEYPNQNLEIAEKHSKTSYNKKEYTFPSGKIINIQGYEKFALDFLLNNENINENDICSGCKNVPTIWYNDENGKKHRHYVDIFIPSQNKCIEVKSTWTAEKKKDCIFLKQNAAKELGYNYEIWVYDRKGNIVNKYL